ncbi:MAG: hypothetical protein R3B52_00280 [Candidatus Paceibacterota bacterium]
MSISSTTKNILLAVVISAVMIFSATLVSADSVSTSVTVGNATPSISSVSVNSGSNITLTEGIITVATTTLTVTDTNGCGEIFAVTLDFYRSGITATGCDTSGESDNNNCYAQVTCVVLDSNTCDGGSDTSAAYGCGVPIQYYADPTDTGSFSAQNWVATLKAGDGTATSTDSTGTTEINTLQALDVTASIAYGTLAAGSDSADQNSTTTVTNTGNVDMDPQLSGTNMTSGGDTLTVGNQEYDADPFVYSAGTDLSTTPTYINITLPQPTNDGNPTTTDTISWGLGVPPATAAGTYTGTNTITSRNCPVVSKLPIREEY